MNFGDIEYLKDGNEKQIRMYELLNHYDILTSLSAFDPIVVGTIPIEVDIDSSDIDVICYCKDEKHITETFISYFQDNPGFKIARNQGPDRNAVIANFMLGEFEVEIFGQNIPTRQQLAYRHMLIEYKLLQEKGESFRRQIIELKRQGLKTEPAFAFLLDLDGDPYEALLRL